MASFFVAKQKGTNDRDIFANTHILGHFRTTKWWSTFFFKASEMMSGVGGVYASVKAKHCNTAREGHFGESAPTKPQVGGWVGAVHRIWVTFGVPVRGTSQICLRGLRHED